MSPRAGPKEAKPSPKRKAKEAELDGAPRKKKRKLEGAEKGRKARREGPRRERRPTVCVPKFLPRNLRCSSEVPGDKRVFYALNTE